MPRLQEENKMTTVRAAKSKGNSFEYDLCYTLSKVYPDIVATERRGFVNGYDLISKEKQIVIECKFHQRFTWNELVGYLAKLKSRSPVGYAPFLVFKSNHQPVLVMSGNMVTPFESLFGIKFEQRPKGYTKGLGK